MLILRLLRAVMLFLIAFVGWPGDGHVFAEPWKVWGNGYLPPMAYLEKGVAKGFGFEITKAVLDEAGVAYRIELAPWQRAYKEAKDGNGMIFGMYWTESRAKIFDYSAPLWEEKIVLVTRRGKAFPFTEMNDLKGKVIALQRGTRPGTEFERALEAKVFMPEPDNDPIARLHKLYKGRVDAAVFNPGVAAVVWNAHRAGLSPEDFTVLETPLAVKAKHIGIAKRLSRKDVVQRIDAAIAKAEGDGTLARITKSYESTEPR